MFPAYVVCTSMFPLCAGLVMSDRLALIFVWGIVFLDDLSYVPPDLTFFYGVISVAFVVGPLILVLVSISLPFSMYCHFPCFFINI